MIVLHGDNKVLSRKALAELKEKAGLTKEVVVLDGGKVSVTELKQALESGSLFGGDRLVVLEDPKKEIIKELNGGFASELIVWSSKALTPAVLKGLGGEAKEFKVSAEIFKLMDSLRPGNLEQMLELWGKSLEQEAAELVFFMLTRQVRMLIQAKEDPAGLKGNPYVVSKVKQQVRYFSIEKLLELHQGLYLIDKGIKTGSSPLSIEHGIEMWLLGM